MPAPHSRLATLDDDGWTLEDAEDVYARGDRLYWLPSRWSASTWTTASRTADTPS